MIDTHGLKMTFGKHVGELVTRVPVGYLRWAVSIGADSEVPLKDGGSVPFAEVAKAEIERRGERLQDVEVSAHAIDRLSLRFRKVWHENRNPDDGLYTWAQKYTLGLLAMWKAGKIQPKETEDRMVDGQLVVERVVFEHLGIKWVIQVNLVIPVLLTCK